MAFKLTDVNGYGTGALGDITNPTGQINSYANVTAYTASTITIGTPNAGAYETFAVGKEIMLHISATSNTSTDVTYLGNYLVCKITAANGSVLTIDKDFTTIMPAAQLVNYIVQAITIAQSKTLTLSSGSVTPPAYSTTNKYGGILLAKCSDTVTFSGGSINLVDKGIPVASTAYRPKTAQELQGTADTDKYAGWENHIAARQFLLNCGDGAAMICAKHYVQTGTASRIGGTAAGVQFTRGTTVGGSTIALVCGDMSGFDPSIISKTKGTGQGLGRCYIASNTKLRNDEGLYAYDVISDPLRLMKTLNIKNYGDGSLGDVTNPTAPMNNYARVTEISADGKTIAYTNKTTTGMAPITTGSLVMFHVSAIPRDYDKPLLGKFVLAKVLSDTGFSVILDTSVTSVFDASKVSTYKCQLISVAQFNNLTLSTQYTGTTAWDRYKYIGGVCAIAVKGSCDIAGGGIILQNKGLKTWNDTSEYWYYGNVDFVGNAQDCDILPLSVPDGSLLLTAKTLNMNANSRLGGKHDGSNFGGFGLINPRTQYTSGGYKSLASSGNDEDCTKIGKSYMYRGSLNASGSHLFVVADTINNMSIKCLSTGGRSCTDSYDAIVGLGGAGYGGGGEAANYSYAAAGSYSAGGNSGNGMYGGNSGWAFVYCNKVVNEDTTGVVI